MDEPPDLVERGGDEDVEALLARHLPGLRAYLRLRMGPELRARESASDLAQSTCREILEHLDRYRFRGDENFRHWLFATALRKVKNKVKFHRADRRAVAREVSPRDASGDDALAALYQTLSTPSRRLMSDERIAALEAAFERLSDPHREVILLARIVGLSHAEVAAAMGRTVEATRSLLHRALAELTEEVRGGEERP